jgi:hypothetical protein
LKFARRTLKKEASSLRKIAGANFVSAGVGLRRRGSDEGLERELVLTVVLRKKWKPGKEPKGEPWIPGGFSGTITVNGERRRVSIRTDVRELPAGGAQRMDGELNVYASSGSQPKNGSLCCLVKKAGDASLYALSCKHVLGVRIAASGAGQNPHLIGVDGKDPATVPVGSGGPGHAGPDVAMSAWHPNSTTPSLDVAIAKVRVPSAFSSEIQGHVSTDICPSLDEVSPGLPCLLVTRHAVRNVEITEVLSEGGELEGFPTTAGDVSLTFEHLIGYEGEGDDDIPVRGDSGGALLYDADGDGHGLLLGMHCWGDEEGLGYSQFIGDVLGSGATGSKLQVVSTHGLF